MNDYWIFFFPANGDRAAAINGDILCPMMQVSAPTDEAVMLAFPYACRIYSLDRGWIAIASVTAAA